MQGLDLIPAISLRLVAECFDHGRKHDSGAEPGWTKRDPEYYQAKASRHYQRYMYGTFYDKDSGLPHLAHVASNVLILLALELRRRLVSDIHNQTSTST